MRVEFVLMVGILVAGVLLSPSVSADSYIHANGKLIARINETDITYYHSDNLGSTSAMTDEAGVVVEEQTNMPFGAQFSDSSHERYQFTGKEFDSGLNLNYFGARYYSPETGRFLTVDPAMQNFTFYGYAGGNPVNRIDPDGRFFFFAGCTSCEKPKKVVDFSEDSKFKLSLKKIIKESDGTVGLFVHPTSTEEKLDKAPGSEPDQVDSIDEYHSYLDRLAQFLKQTDYPILIFAESHKIKGVKKWLEDVVPKKLTIIVPTYHDNPTPNLRRISFQTPQEWDGVVYEPWRRVLGDLEIKKIILGGETAYRM